MSGIEVVGLVLGAFPLVVSAMEKYRDAFEPLRDWWKFERTFEDFINDVGLQRALFDNNLEKLLSPFVESDIHMGVLLRHPFGPSWRDPDLDRKLQSRLGLSFTFYRSIVDRMNETLDDLKRLLGLDKGQTLDLWQRREPSRSEIKTEFKRLRIAFSKNKFHHVDSLSKQNDNLTKLLQSSDDLVVSRKQRSTTPNSEVLRKLQSSALGLYSILNKAWTCSCQSHSTHLRLERRVNGNAVTDENWKLLLPTKDHTSSALAVAEVEVHVEDDTVAEDELDSNTPDTTPNDLYEVKHAIDRRKYQAATSQTNATAKFASMTTILSGSAGGTRAVENMLASAAMGPPSHGRKKQVAFAYCASPTTRAGHTIREISPPITDMCSALLAIDDKTACLGFLQDQCKRRHTFYPGQQRKAGRQLTLRDALKAESSQVKIQKMPKRDRLTIGMILASSLLQLHTTPWLYEKWTKDDIILPLDETQMVVVPDPLISKTFESISNSSSKLDQPSDGQGLPSKFNTKIALSSLGITLLELCFGKPIEDHPQRPEFFGPNNQPNTFTDISTARLWHEKIADKMGDKMSDCIRRCLDCAFAPKPNLEDRDFQEAFFDGVLVPLQEVLRIWERD